MRTLKFRSYFEREHEFEIQQALIIMIQNVTQAVSQLSEKWVQVQLFEKENLLILQIRDSGFGIPAEIEKKMFQPVFKTNSIGEFSYAGKQSLKRFPSFTKTI